MTDLLLTTSNLSSSRNTATAGSSAQMRWPCRITASTGTPLQRNSMTVALAAGVVLMAFFAAALVVVE